jgi:polygalacturonase
MSFSARIVTSLVVLCTSLPIARALEPAVPRIPAREFSAAELGVVADTDGPVTEALQKAIDHVAAEGGGRLVIGPGSYVSGPIVLPVEFDLHLAKDATLKMLPREADYPSERDAYRNFIVAAGVHDLRISGEGVIDGQGEPWWREFRGGKLTLRRPQLIAIDHCDRVELTGITTRNPPNTHMALRLCRDVRIDRCTLDAPGDSINTDGINISARNCLITGCYISTGDDNIAILTHAARDWQPPICEHFVIRNCAFGSGHGVSIGSFTSGGVRDVLMERCSFDKTTAGIRMKAGRDRGGLVEDVIYRKLTMRRVKNPIYITSYYPKEPAQRGDDAAEVITANTPRWRGIRIEDLTVTDAENSITLWGVPEQPIEAIRIENATLASERGAKLFNVVGYELENVSVNAAKGPMIATHQATGTIAERRR